MEAEQTLKRDIGIYRIVDEALGNAVIIFSPCAYDHSLRGYLAGFYQAESCNYEDLQHSESIDVMVLVTQSYNEIPPLYELVQDRTSAWTQTVAILEIFTKDARLDLMALGLCSILPASSEINLLQANLLQAARRARRENKRISELESMSHTARTAITAVSEFGTLLRYLEKTGGKSTIDGLAQATIEFMESLNLQGAIRISTDDLLEYAGTGAGPNNIQREVLDSLVDRLQQKGRILTMRSERIAWVCYGKILEDEEVSGRYRDILIQGCDILESRVRTLSLTDVLKDQCRQVFDLMHLVQRAQSDSQRATNDIMRKLAANIETAAISLDLTEDQETALLRLSNGALDDLEKLFEGFDLLEEHFMEVLGGLDRALSLIDVVEEELGDADDSDGIDLF